MPAYKIECLLYQKQEIFNMNHSELFFGYPSGIELIQGRKTFNQMVTINTLNEALMFQYGNISVGRVYSTFKQTSGDLLLTVNGGGGLNVSGATCSFSGISTGLVVATGGMQLNSTAASSPFATCNSSTGGSATADSRLLFLSASAISYKALISGQSAVSPGVNTSYASLVFGYFPSTPINIGSSGTHAMFAHLVIRKLAVATAAGTLTNSAAIYIEDVAAEATNNYAIFADAGLNRFDGNTCIGTGAVPGTTSFLFLGAATTAKSSLNIASGAAPTSPQDGDMWYDGTDVKFRVGGSTKTFTLT
jgi:hypothetical protein